MIAKSKKGSETKVRRKRAESQRKTRKREGRDVTHRNHLDHRSLHAAQIHLVLHHGHRNHRASVGQQKLARALRGKGESVSALQKTTQETLLTKHGLFGTTTESTCQATRLPAFDGPSSLDVDEEALVHELESLGVLVGGCGAKQSQ